MQAIREQNVQVAAGVIGASPSLPGTPLQLSVNARGRLQTEDEFGDIVVKTTPDGGVTHLRDIARIQLDASEYGLRSLLDNKPAVAMAINQSPGANSLQISDEVRKTMAELKQDMPAGVDYKIVYDPTQFVRSSIKAVVHTLLEAIALVVIVVIVFLQAWRASLIPLIAVPVSIIGTFSLLLAFGYSINALSLFGMVLAIGIVVDDAIVVVENVERNIESGMNARAATYKAMQEVSGPIIAIALTLVAVFVPLAFMSGLTGQFYKQFAMTIAISTVISAFNSLTLSPALSAILLKGHGDKEDWLTRVMNRVLGGFFRGFNKVFHRGAENYGRGVRGVLSRKTLMLGVYLVLVGATVLVSKVVPGGFVPAQDKEYLIAFAQLPNGASLDRTEKVIRDMGSIALKQPGVESAVAFPGLSVNGFTNSSSAGIVFVTLKPFSERHGKALSAGAIAGALNQKYGAMKDSFVAVFPPPPVLGLGTLGGFKMQVEDRGAVGYARLADATNDFIKRAQQAPELGPLFTSYQINVPQLNVDLDRVKAKQLGVPVTDVFNTMQVYLGSLYVNDFNRFGRVYQVRVQADAPFRQRADDILQLKTRNDKGRDGAAVVARHGDADVRPGNGRALQRLHGGGHQRRPGAGLRRGRRRPRSSASRMKTPRGVRFEWTDLTYQQILAGDSAMYVFPISVLLVFLVLAALYESLTLPLAVILIVPMSILSALTGVWLTQGDNNIFTQIGLMVLVGLSAKNAILIVEFARELEHDGRTPLEAAIEASRLRLRPILMTSIAFIMGWCRSSRRRAPVRKCAMRWVSPCSSGCSA